MTERVRITTSVAQVLAALLPARRYYRLTPDGADLARSELAALFARLRPRGLGGPAVAGALPGHLTGTRLDPAIPRSTPAPATIEAGLGHAQPGPV